MSAFGRILARLLAALPAAPASGRPAGEGLDALVRGTPDLAVVIDGEGRILYESPSVRALLGLPSGELLGGRLWGLLHPDDVARVRRDARALRGEAGATRAFEARVRGDDGAWRWVEAVGNNRLDDPRLRAVAITARDVTDRKEAEELRRQMGLYEGVIEALGEPGHGILVEEEGRVRYANAAFCRMSGYDREELEARKTLEEILPKKEAPGGGDGTYHPTALRRKDGRTTDVEVAFKTSGAAGPARTIALVREAAGSGAGWERFRLQARLLDALGEAVIATDARRRVTYWNRAAERLYGWSAAETMGRGLGSFLVSEELRGPDAEALAEVASGKAWSGRFVVRRKDGTSFPVQVTETPVHDEAGNLVGMVGISTDIAERERAELALRESEARYRSLVEQVPAIIYVEAVDEGESEWDMLYVSPQQEELLGYSTEEWTSDSRLWERLLHPDDRERVMAEDERTDRTGEPFRADYRFIARDGRTVWVRDEALLVHDEEGKPLFWQGVMYDVTEQKRAEEEVQRLNEDLERRVAERTAQLEAYAGRLAASNRELQDFAYVASHDLQEPLRKVLAFGERLRTRSAGVLDERGLEYLGRMEDAAWRMQKLIEDLLVLSRVTTQARPFEPVELGKVVAEVLSDLEARLEETGGAVEVGQMPTVEADGAQMRQLLQNLIGNALKFHKAGEPPLVRVYCVQQAGRSGPGAGPAEAGVYRLVVEDNGIGFDERYIEGIFAPFERLHGRGAYEGTGMGLAICRKVVERHGGEITAESTPGEGSTFIVTLPSGQQEGPPERGKAGP